jgi:hypothetical protein
LERRKRRWIVKKSEKLNLCVAWYKPEQWPRLLEISADSDKLEETYGEWLIIAEKALKDFAALGVFPEKMVVDVEDLLVWCRAEGVPVNGPSRSQYAALMLEERVKGKK